MNTDTRLSVAAGARTDFLRARSLIENGSRTSPRVKSVVWSVHVSMKALRHTFCTSHQSGRRAPTDGKLRAPLLLPGPPIESGEPASSPPAATVRSGVCCTAEAFGEAITPTKRQGDEGRPPCHSTATRVIQHCAVGSLALQQVAGQSLLPWRQRLWEHLKPERGRRPHALVGRAKPQGQGPIGLVALGKARPR